MVLHGDRRLSMAPVRQCEPLRELASRFIGRPAVKRHHGCGHPRRTPELCAPPVADGRHLDLVRTPANGFFEAMNCHVVSTRSRCVKRR
jgi:hypothetical protein